MTITRALELSQIAKSFARLADPVRNYRLGAVAIRGQQLFSGWNSYQTHPLQARYAKNPYAIHLHAEIAAMIRAKWQAEALVVVRLMADGTLGLARPCEGCTRALVSVPEIWYSTGLENQLAKVV